MSRGMDNNNPFNLRYEEKIPWMGLAQPPHDAEGYCVFNAYANPMNKMFWGLRAGFRDLFTKWGIDKLRTIDEMVDKFAPAADANNVTAYKVNVCKQTGWEVDEQLDLLAPGALMRLGKGFLVAEQGEAGLAQFNDSQLGAAVQSAMVKRG